MSRAARLLDLIEALRRHRRPVRGADLAGDSASACERSIATSPRCRETACRSRARRGSARPAAGLHPAAADVRRGRGGCARPRPALHRAPAAGASGQQGGGALARSRGAAAGQERGRRAASRGTAKPGGGCLPRTDPRRHPRRAVARPRHRDAEGRETTRRVWPVAVGFFEVAEMLAAWCELRADFATSASTGPTGTATGLRMGRRHRTLRPSGG